MSQSRQDLALDIFTHGLEKFVKATGDSDKEMLTLAGMAFREVKDVFVENIKAGDACTFAFPSMVVLPDMRVPCLVAILTDRVIVAWRKGVFRKTTVSRVIPKRAIKQASWGISNRPGTNGAFLLTINTDETLSIALPQGKRAVADAILAAVQTQ